jgi:glycosyltransferase involved in cell wall biosynthesis
MDGTEMSAIIYTHSMISGSMTFIKSHAESLRRFTPIYAGAHRVKGLALPEDRLFVVNNGSLFGSLREFLFRDLGFAPRFIKRLEATNPAIVHTHFGTSGPAGMVLGRKMDVPLVVTFHGKDATMSEEELRRSRRGRHLIRDKAALIRNTDCFIAVSDYVLRCLLDRGYPEEKIVVHRNGIDLDYFKPLNAGDREKCVLFVGRFTEKKGVEYLVRAAGRLADAGEEFELVLVGDGPLRQKLEGMVRGSRIRCRFPGFLPHEQVRQWIGKAAVVVVPSVVAADGDSEGLPTILLEAQAMETPVVATRHSGIPEGVREGVTADLVEERDADALAARISELLRSVEKSRSYGTAGREFMVEQFNLRKQVDGLEDIYAAAVDRYAREAGRRSEG